MIQANDLIAKFTQALNESWGYIYGKTHDKWTEAKQAEYKKLYESDPKKYADRKTSAEKGGKWVGHWVTDCSGLFVWALNQFGIAVPHGSNSIWDRSLAQKGKLPKADIKPGTAVFVTKGDNRSHIGLYIGNGYVIEAQGTVTGVVKSKLSNKKWVEWGELRNVDYTRETQIEPAKGTAIVTDTRVALRYGPSTSARVITRIDEGQTVKLLPEPEGWQRVEYNGKTGYMMNEFLKKG